MENYIVRIYRRDEYQPGSLVGLVELVETGETQRFRTLSELTSIFAKTPAMMEEQAAGEKPHIEPA